MKKFTAEAKTEIHETGHIFLVNIDIPVTLSPTNYCFLADMGPEKRYNIVSLLFLLLLFPAFPLSFLSFGTASTT